MKKLIIINNAIFIAFLSFFSISYFVVPDKDFSDQENRSLEEFPEFTLKDVLNGDAARLLEVYIQDQFPYRSPFVELKTRTNLLLSNNYNNGVYITNDRLVQGLDSIHEARFSANLRILENYAANTNIPTDLMIIPTSSYFYFDLIANKNIEPNQEQIISTINEKTSSLSKIDLIKPLQESNIDPYYLGDHHLNTDGSFIAYSAYMEYLNQPIHEFEYKTVATDFVGSLSSLSGAFWYNQDEIIQPILANPLDIEVIYNDSVTTNTLFNDENLLIKDKYTYFLDGNQALVEIKTNQKDKEDLLVVSDSYGHLLAPYLIANFNNITFVDLRYYTTNISMIADNYDRVLLYYGIDSILNEAGIAYIR